MSDSKMTVMAFLNRKGGVGKTSLTHHLAGAFSKLGKRVLLVDNDPQASLTQGFFGPDATRNFDPCETVASLYAGGDPFPELMIRSTSVPRVDLIAGSIATDEFNVPVPWSAPEESRTCLARFLDQVSGRYDLALIDCPPDLHLCSWAALVAANHLLVPVMPEDYAAQGLIDVLDAADRVREADNADLDVLGFVLNRVEGRRKIHGLFETTLRENYGDLIFRTRIPNAVAYVEAITRRRPIEQYQPRSGPASAVRALAVELLERARVGQPAACVEGLA